MHSPVGYWIVLAFVGGLAIGVWTMWALDMSIIHYYEELAVAAMQLCLPRMPL